MRASSTTTTQYINAHLNANSHIMDLCEIRRELKTKRIYDLPLRVTYYARVSSDSDNQLNSLDNQVFYYENLIQSNPNWIFVEGYVDEGMSGATVRKRENFQRMVEDAEVRNFDLVLTKEITRFARNTLDSILYTRQLLSHDVGVFFETDNILTFDEDSEFRLTIMAGVAQDDLRKHSNRIKFGHAQAIKRGVVLGCPRIYGYDWVDKRLRPNDHAPMVRELFELYATGEHSTKTIATLFWEKGYRSHAGTRIAPQVFRQILSNPRYKGYYVGGKTKSIDIFTKKCTHLPQEEWTIYKDETGEITPALVSEELWAKANEVLERRSVNVKNRTGVSNHSNLMTGKLYCTHCNKTYYHREKEKTGSRWVCSGKINNGASSCPSFRIFQDELTQILLEVFHETCAMTEDAIEKYAKMFQSLDERKDISKNITKLKKQIEVEVKKKDKLLEHNATGLLSNQDFASMMANCSKEIENAEIELFELENQIGSKKEMERHLNLLRKLMYDAKKDAKNGAITRGFVEKYIDKIYVTSAGEDSLHLEIKLFTGATTEKYLSNIRKHWNESDKNNESINPKKRKRVRSDNKSSNIVPVHDAMPL